MSFTIQSWLPRLHLNSLVIIIGLLFSTSNIGCASRTPTYGYKDEHFTQFIISYQKEAAKFATINQHALANDIYTLEIKFAPGRTKTELGYFYQDFHDRMIVINEDTFFDLDYDGQEQLLYHELTHALFHAKHNDRMLGQNYPASIMSTYHYKTYNSKTRDMYINQLFGIDIYQTH